MIIDRPHYLKMLKDRQKNGLVKIITGIRRCGKSFLLNTLYRNLLISEGVSQEDIISLSLEDLDNAPLRNPMTLYSHIKDKVRDTERFFYIFLDEIQMVESIDDPYAVSEKRKIGFTQVLLSLMKLENVDIYVTGSNSRMLSSDILTEFRGRGDEIHLWPLSYSEFRSAWNGKDEDAWRQYITYGGLPYIMTLKEDEDRSRYLRSLFQLIYKKDILERNMLHNGEDTLDMILDVISSSIGSLTNPNRLSNTLRSRCGVNISSATVSRYISFFMDSFLIEEARRFDVKGRNYIGSPYKYYFSDMGLRNARLSFRQTEETHLMENMLYNELRMRGYDVDVGIVTLNSKNENGSGIRVQREVDFVVNRSSRRYYIQSAFSIPDREKYDQEAESLRHIDDSFAKIIVVRSRIVPHFTDDGFYMTGIEDFLLDGKILEKI